MYNLISGYEEIADLLCLVFDPWTAATSSVNADQLLTASMSWVIVFSTEGKISLRQFETLVGHLCGTHGGAIMMVGRRI